MPSKRPPDGTVSLCDPTAMTPSAGFSPSTPPDQIAGGIDANRESRFREALGEPSAAFEKQRAERAARVGALGLGDFRQRHDVGPETVGVERQRGRHFGSRSMRRQRRRNELAGARRASNVSIFHHAGAAHKRRNNAERQFDALIRDSTTHNYCRCRRPDNDRGRAASARYRRRGRRRARLWRR